MLVREALKYIKRILTSRNLNTERKVSKEKFASFFMLLTSKVQAVIQMENMGFAGNIDNIEKMTRNSYPDCVSMIESRTSNSYEKFLVEFKDIDITPVLESILACKEPFRYI
jgi:hypothetical protein